MAPRASIFVRLSTGVFELPMRLTTRQSSKLMVLRLCICGIGKIRSIKKPLKHLWISYRVPLPHTTENYLFARKIKLEYASNNWDVCEKLSRRIALHLELLENCPIQNA